MNLNTSTGTVLDRVALACGALSICIGGAGLAGWAFDLRVLAGVRLDYIPMAPNTALIVILLGGALFSGIAWPGNRTIRIAIAGVSSLCILIAGLTLIGIVTGIDLKIDHLLVNAPGTIGTAPVGHMSPITAICFLLGSAALLLLLSKKNDLVSLLGTVMVLVGGVLIIGYWYGAPLLYGGTVIPVALTTAVALGVLGVGLNAAAGPDSWPLSSVAGASTRARLLRGLLPAILLLVLIINWFNAVILGDADSSVVLFSAVTVILSLLVVYGVVTWVSHKIGDAIDRSERERKKAEEALHESEEKYRTYIDNSPEGIFIVDAAGNYKDANPSAYSMLGYSREELLSLSIRDLTPASTLESGLHNFLKLKETGSLMTELELVKKNGDTVPVIMNAVKLPDERYLAFCTDITGRKHVEEALRESEERYRTVIENASEAIVVAQDGLLKYANPRTMEILQSTPEKVIGRPFTDFIHPDDRALVFERYQHRLKGENVPVNYDFRLIGENGGLIWVIISAVRIPWEGRPATLNFLTEITKRKQAEEKLKFSNVLLSTQQDVSIDGILVVDNSGKIISFNKRFVDIWGIPPDVIASQSDERALQSVLDRLVSPAEFLDRVRYLYEHKEEKSREEIALVDGRTLDRYSAPMIGSDGKYYGRVWFFRDITEQKQADMAVRESEQKFRDIFNNTTDAIQIHEIRDDGTPGKFTVVNDVACQMLQYTKEEMLTKTPLDFTTGYHNPPIERVFEEQRTIGNARFETEQRRKDGTIIQVEVNSHVVTLQGKKVMLAVVREITERKKAEALLKRFNEELEQKVQSRTEELNVSLEEKIVLLREVHHRVNNNLQILISLLNLQSRTITDPLIIEALKESTQRIRAMSMVHEKLYAGSDLSHIDFVSYLSSLAKSQVASYQIDPRKVTLETTKETIMLDINTAIPLGLVMNELVSNALKHAFPGDRKGTIRIDARETADQLEISIADDGVGVPEGFDWKTAPSLGLRLVNILIEQLSGTITPDRTKAGTVYHISIPKKER